MPTVALIVEGEGETEAVPILLRALLSAEQRYNIRLLPPKNAHGCGNLTKQNGLERFVRYCLMERCDGILILMDSDASCPVDLAHEFATRIAALNPSVPIAVAFAKREFEAWFISSAEELIECGLQITRPFNYPPDVDLNQNPKSWVNSHLPDGIRYKETIDQPKFTARINLVRTREKSRSFRHLSSAFLQLLQAIDSRVGGPIPSAEEISTKRLR